MPFRIRHFFIIALLHGSVSSSLAVEPAETPEAQTEEPGVVIEDSPASFLPVLESLEAGAFEKADRELSKRVRFLQEALERDWLVSDGEPPLLQSLIVSYYLKIALGDGQGVIAIYDYLLEDLGYSDPQVLGMSIARLKKAAEDNPAAYRKTVVALARMTWKFRDLQQRDADLIRQRVQRRKELQQRLQAAEQHWAEQATKSTTPPQQPDSAPPPPADG
ncbi:MAG: hypothetical protein KDD44_09980 [Bdellovibrionales bacterium]|nr:hypothetical protein [Bdellovibrionales bacterium]